MNAKCANDELKFKTIIKLFSRLYMTNSLIYKANTLVLIYEVKSYTFLCVFNNFGISYNISNITVSEDHISLITWSLTPAAAATVAAPVLKEWSACLELYKPILKSKDLRC